MLFLKKKNKNEWTKKILVKCLIPGHVERLTQINVKITSAIKEMQLKNPFQNKITTTRTSQSNNINATMRGIFCS